MRAAILVAALSAASVLTAGQAGAAVLSVPVGSNGAAFDRSLLSSSARGTETAQVFQIGEGAGVNNGDYRAYVPFALTAQDQADVAATGTTVKLFVNLGVNQNATGTTFSLVGLPGRGAAVTAGAASAGIVGTPADYSSASTAILSGIVVSQGTYSFDVTSYVKAQASSNSAIAFRLQGDNVATADALQNALTFSSADNATVANRPTLTIATVPEPTAIAAIAGVGACVLRRRRPASA